MIRICKGKVEPKVLTNCSDPQGNFKSAVVQRLMSESRGIMEAPCYILIVISDGSMPFCSVTTIIAESEMRV